MRLIEAEALLRSQDVTGGMAALNLVRTNATAGTVTAEHLARWTGRADADGRVEGRFDLTVESDTAGLRSVGGTVDAIGGAGGVRVPPLHAARRGLSDSATRSRSSARRTARSSSTR